MVNAYKDENDVSTLIACSNVDGQTPVRLYADPVTHRLLVDMSAGFNYADNETPSGTVDGANTTFTLAHSPSPAGSLQFFVNGQLLKSGGIDYTLLTNTVTTNFAPPTGSVLVAWYRY